jgi:small ligand-binding sensory domain FIST
MRFIEKETGKPILRSDATSLMIINEHEHGIKRLRSINRDISPTDNSLQLYGGIAVGQKVQVCLAQPELIIEETYKLAALAAAENTISPVAAIIVSCAGRKKMLGTRLHHEITAVSQHFGKMPLVGFPSLGEVGPLRTVDGYSGNLFHNMTYVLLLIGL